MKTLAAAALTLLLAGCASMPRPQALVVPHGYTKAAKIVQPEPQSSPAIATPLVKPKWYDHFRQKNGRFFH